MSDPGSMFTGRVDEAGTLILDETERAAYRNHLQHLAGRRVVIAVKRRFARRTARQNRFYWKCVVTPLAAHLGYERGELHELLAMRFLRIEDCPITGAPRRKRTPQTNTPEFSEYLEACMQFAAEHGVVVRRQDYERWMDAEADPE